jgi:hypothetical protein
MSEALSLSIFTIEVDRKATLALQCKWHSEAEALFSDEALKSQLRLLKSGGRPLCDDFSIFRIRLARKNERELYFQNAASLLTSSGHLAALLVSVDDQEPQRMS